MSVCEISEILASAFSCSICTNLFEKPVTTPCGHSFCLKCFQKWNCGRGEKTCAICRQSIPAKVVKDPSINSVLVFAIGMARESDNDGETCVNAATHLLHNQNKPDKAYTTENAKKNALANASSGKILVTVPTDHFGPIPPENDPTRNQGLLVGESWPNRLECRQWGAHFVTTGGISGQSDRGAQSVVLSAGGYVDDHQDNGEWFLYTGSGGRDLSTNIRTNMKHCSDQTFVRYNKSLQVSCLKGYPVRVVRSYSDKRSVYAPTERGVRYDGIYRIEKCWQIVGLQGFKICRYLFVRCDNEPAPWTSDDHGDRPRPLPAILELMKATNIHERTEDPAWDFDEMESTWKWMKPPPPSGRKIQDEEPTQIAKSSKNILEILRRGFSCLLCFKVMVSPVTTPCGHKFCKPCLEGVFSGKSSVKERSWGTGSTLRSKKVVMECPACTHDISDYLQNVQVNIVLKDAIESLKAKIEENEESLNSSEDANTFKDEDTGSVKENSEVNKALDEAVEGNAKRKKDNSSEELADQGDGEKAKRGRKSEKVEEAVDEANDSPDRAQLAGPSSVALERPKRVTSDPFWMKDFAKH